MMLYTCCMINKHALILQLLDFIMWNWAQPTVGLKTDHDIYITFNFNYVPSVTWTKCIKQQGLKSFFWEQLNWLVFFVIASIHLDAVTQMLHHMLLIFVRNLVIQRLHFYLVAVMI